MQLWWGNTAFPVNAAAVTGTVGYVRSQAGRPLQAVVRAEVTATLFGEGQANLTAQEQVIRSALMTPYRDLILRRDDGGAAGLSLVNNTSLTGCVVVSGPDFFRSDGSEYVTTRQFRFVVEATYAVAGAEAALFSWTQTISVTGNGGPRRTWRLPLNADPVRQVVTPRTIIRYVQVGQAVGHLLAPTAPPPVFGAAYLVNESVSVSSTPGEPMGRAWRMPAVQWNYVFESDRPLFGTTPLPVF